MQWAGKFDWRSDSTCIQTTVGFISIDYVLFQSVILRESLTARIYFGTISLRGSVTSVVATNREHNIAPDAIVRLGGLPQRAKPVDSTGKARAPIRLGATMEATIWGTL